MANSATSFEPSVPRFLYGTAWKEDETRRLTTLALRAGFRGIDTANQRRHYCEEAVGDGIADAADAGLVRREDVFLQTKYTFLRGQDHRLPYDPKATIAEQVRQSFESSLKHLRTTWIDSYVLHGPSLRNGLSADDWDAWGAMEAIHATGQAKHLGVSNVSLEQLQLLCDKSKVRPRFVQNRCYANTGWDHAVRQFCSNHSMVYQGFSLLTANRDVLTHPTVRQIAQRRGCNPAQIIFRFALEVGMLPLTGTTKEANMRADLAVLDFSLDSGEVDAIEALS